MDFFDKLTKKATETYKGAAEKTGKLAKEAKIKIKINENKSKINDLYQEIGKKVYQKHSSNEDVCVKKEIEEECAKIDILSSEIDTYHKEILNLSNVKACVKCNEHMDKKARFCPKCGAEQPEEVEETLEVEIINEEDSTKEDIEVNEPDVVVEENNVENSEEYTQENEDNNSNN